MAKLGDLVVGVGANTSDFNHKMREVRKQMSTTMGEVKNIGKSMSIGLTAPFAALGAVAVKTAADFEFGMAKVKAVSGFTADEMKRLNAQAKELGGSTSKSASDVSSLQLELAKLGKTSREIEAMTESVLSLSIAFDTDLGETSRIVGESLNQFGLDAKESGRIADNMAVLFGSSALDLEKFGTAMSVVGPTAAAMGLSIEETGAALGTLVNAGVDASTAGTSLTKALTTLAAKGMNGQQAMTSLFNGTLSVAEGFDIFGDRAGKIIPILQKSGESMADLTKKQIEGTGAAADARKVLENTAQGGFDRLKSSIEAMAIAFGEGLLPLVNKATAFFSKIATIFAEMNPVVQQLVSGLGLTFAAIGPLLFTIPTLIGNFKLMKTALKAAKAEMLAFNAATLANPYVLAAAAIAAIGLAMYGLYDASTDAEDKVAELREELKGMESDEAARYAAQRIREQEEAVKKQIEAVKALRAAANMGDATERRIHSQTLARQEEVLANEQAKLDGYKREAFILEGQQQYQEMLVRLGEKKVQLQEDDEEAKKRALEAMKEEVALEKWLADFRSSIAEDILIEPVVAPQYDPSGLELEGLEDIPDMAQDMTEQFEDDFQVDEVAFEKWQKARENMAMFKDATSKMFDYMAMNAANWSNSLGQAFGTMAQDAEAGKEAMKDATKGIINQALAASQAAIIEAMINSGKFSGPAAPIVIPALVAGGIGLIQGLFNDIPAFAAGGIVSGPTVGLMGEYPGAKTNPEVIAPLDKLQSMLQADKQQVVVSGRIDGNAIRLANDRTNRNAKRFLR